MKKYWFKFWKKVQGSDCSKSLVHKTSKIEPGTEFISSKIDRYSFVGHRCLMVNVHIGSFVSIADDVKIGGGMHPVDWGSTSPVFYSGRDSVNKKFSEYDREEVKTTEIGSDVWIGQGVHIKQGVRVGHGSVIGMGSVVTKNIEPYSIVGGVPAKILKYRFDEEIIQLALKSKWWEKSDKEIHLAANLIKNPIEYFSFFLR